MNHKKEINKLIVYFIREEKGGEIKDTIIGYISKKGNELTYEENQEIKDPLLRNKYIEELENYVQGLIKNEAVMVGWCEETTKDGKLIHHQYARFCPVGDPEFLGALHDTILKRKDELLGRQLTVDVIAE